MKPRWKLTLIAAIAVGSVGMANADIVWPEESGWTALMKGTDMYHDAVGDQHPDSIDLIGTTNSYSAGHWAFVENGDISGGTTNDAFMFRMRVGSDGGRFVWQVNLDTDGDASNVEWILQLVQSGNKANHGVELVQTAIGGTTLGDVDIGANTSSWQGDLNTYSRWVPIADSTDYYVGFAIPWSVFTSVTGVTELEDVRTALSTSTSHANINGDAPLGAALSDPISSVLSESIPEPAVATLLLGVGGGMLAFRRIFRRMKGDFNG